MTDITNEIKARDAKQLNDYLRDMTYRQRVEFTTEVIILAGVKRQTFHNWKSMCCTIPLKGKQAIESVAGRVIFSNDQL